jgi:hypothetical protein
MEITRKERIENAVSNLQKAYFEFAAEFWRKWEREQKERKALEVSRNVEVGNGSNS